MVHFSPMCVHSEAPIDVLLLSISGVSIGRLHTGYELLSPDLGSAAACTRAEPCPDVSHLSQLFKQLSFWLPLYGM